MSLATSCPPAAATGAGFKATGVGDSGAKAVLAKLLKQGVAEGGKEKDAQKEEAASETGAGAAGVGAAGAVGEGGRAKDDL